MCSLKYMYVKKKKKKENSSINITLENFVNTFVEEYTGMPRPNS